MQTVTSISSAESITLFCAATSFSIDKTFIRHDPQIAPSLGAQRFMTHGAHGEAVNHFESALKCFVENKNLFSNATGTPEKWNLYNGLANLAEGMARLEQLILQMSKR